jgi:hypothetical protein
MNTITYIVTIKPVPLDLGINFLEPLGGIVGTFVQPIVPYYRAYMRPFNYHKYKKNFDIDVNVQIFKIVIKVNGEMVNEEITNMFNFTLKVNALD